MKNTDGYRAGAGDPDCEEFSNPKAPPSSLHTTAAEIVWPGVCVAVQQEDST